MNEMRWVLKAINNIRKAYLEADIWKEIETKSLQTFNHWVYCDFLKVPELNIEGGLTQGDLDRIMDRNIEHFRAKLKKEESNVLTALSSKQNKKASISETKKPRLIQALPHCIDSKEFTMMSRSCAEGTCNKDCGKTKIERCMKFISNKDLKVSDNCTMKVKKYGLFTKGKQQCLEPTDLYLTPNEFIDHFMNVFLKYSIHAFTVRLFNQVHKRFSYNIRQGWIIWNADWAAQVLEFVFYVQKCYICDNTPNPPIVTPVS
jgi:hypothetical protein